MTDTAGNGNGRNREAPFVYFSCISAGARVHSMTISFLACAHQNSHVMRAESSQESGFPHHFFFPIRCLVVRVQVKRIEEMFFWGRERVGLHV